MTKTIAWTLSDWQAAYERGREPSELLESLIAELRSDDRAFISQLDADGLRVQVADLAARLSDAGGDRDRLPLYGVPFVVKDNIDAVGFDTTAGCPAFAYTPEQDSHAVARLRDAGAILIAKANLDQFATGLVGTRSPYGAVPNSFDAHRISGGSSSGSASAVARGLVPFALGTDTAGSGRVPAGLNNIIGLKGTCGAISTWGVVPACRSLDCVTVFALTLPDAGTVFDIAAGYDEQDPYSRRAPVAHSRGVPPRPRLGVPADPHWFGDLKQAMAWEQALSDWRNLPVELVPMDFSVFREMAALLYEGPWVAERYAAIETFLETHPDDVNPVVKGIIEKARNFSAKDGFRGEYRRMALRRKIEQAMETIDALLVPTTPTFPTIKGVAADPVTRNSELGTYTNFVNLLDMCALSVPAGFRADGLPFGVTLIGRAWQDRALQSLAHHWLSTQSAVSGVAGIPAAGKATVADMPVTVTSGCIRIAVVGAHLTGMSLNQQLTDRGAIYIEETRTAAHYRLHALVNTTPPKPGLQAVDEGGESIVVELWDMPEAHFASFVSLIPSPLGIGTLSLADGRQVKGFICEGLGLRGAKDVTAFGGWRAFWVSLAHTE